MKSYPIVLIFLILGLSACQNDVDPSADLDVESYIELLRTERYQMTTLPNFTAEDIPALLAYRNETDHIKVFPRNPISSFHMEDCQLGMLVLWTIESIRAVSIQSDEVVMNFPSLNPILRARDKDELEFISESTTLEEAAAAYFDWWHLNGDKEFSEFSVLDPLANTIYTWH
ncbi:MAG: DUF4943 family protein [Cyclobacteriaceae bacterium]|nr:DUF4943 family protein [Cyclobacteriaceae bacterium SS2]